MSFEGGPRRCADRYINKSRRPFPPRRAGAGSGDFSREINQTTCQLFANSAKYACGPIRSSVSSPCTSVIVRAANHITRISRFNSRLYKIA
ncbi:hypothetical protein PUN28_015646 [Cardiocondyla obscurior]|uniref:Uncharacterized protein n=1 Tax=Cardiocondyla obscurior TaxID=286306 RepID=A0AAW2EZC6_9HYME